MGLRMGGNSGNTLLMATGGWYAVAAAGGVCPCGAVGFTGTGGVRCGLGRAADPAVPGFGAMFSAGASSIVVAVDGCSVRRESGGAKGFMGGRNSELAGGGTGSAAGAETGTEARTGAEEGFGGSAAFTGGSPVLGRSAVTDSVVSPAGLVTVSLIWTWSVAGEYRILPSRTWVASSEICRVASPS